MADLPICAPITQTRGRNNEISKSHAGRRQRSQRPHKLRARPQRPALPGFTTTTQLHPFKAHASAKKKRLICCSPRHGRQSHPQPSSWHQTWFSLTMHTSPPPQTLPLQLKHSKQYKNFLGITIAPTGTHFTSYSEQQPEKRQKQQPAAAPKAAAAANPTTPKATAKPSTNRCFLYHRTSESSHKITGTTYINSYYITPPWRYTLGNHINVY